MIRSPVVGVSSSGMTGTPAGVGMLMDPPQLLRAGDTVRVEIERIGAIENRVVDEQPTGGTP